MDFKVNFKKPEKEDLASLVNSFQSLQPYISNAISYSNLYRTTGNEEYREKAILSLNQFEYYINLYNSGVAKFIDNISDLLKGLSKEIFDYDVPKDFDKNLSILLKDLSKSPVKISNIREYKEYFENLKGNDFSEYDKHIKLLEQANNDFFNYIENISVDLSKIIKSYLKYASEE